MSYIEMKLEKHSYRILGTIMGAIIGSIIGGIFFVVMEQPLFMTIAGVGTLVGLALGVGFDQLFGQENTPSNHQS